MGDRVLYFKGPILSNSFPPSKAALNSLLKDALLNIFLLELCFAIPLQNKNFMVYRQNILFYKVKTINVIKAPTLQFADELFQHSTVLTVFV